MALKTSRMLVYGGMLAPLAFGLFDEATLGRLNASPPLAMLSSIAPVVGRLGLGSPLHQFATATAAFECVLFLVYLYTLATHAPFWSRQYALKYAGRALRTDAGKINVGGVLAMVLLCALFLSDVAGLKFVSIALWEMFGAVPNTPTATTIFSSKILTAAFGWGMCLFEVAAYYAVALAAFAAAYSIRDGKLPGRGPVADKIISSSR